MRTARLASLLKMEITRRTAAVVCLVLLRSNSNFARAEMYKHCDPVKLGNEPAMHTRELRAHVRIESQHPEAESLRWRYAGFQSRTNWFFHGHAVVGVWLKSTYLEPANKVDYTASRRRVQTKTPPFDPCSTESIFRMLFLSGCRVLVTQRLAVRLGGVPKSGLRYAISPFRNTQPMLRV